VAALVFARATPRMERRALPNDVSPEGDGYSRKERKAAYGPTRTLELMARSAKRQERSNCSGRGFVR